MSRIELNDSIVDAVAKMADGNPGACRAIMEMIRKGTSIDPQGFMGGFGAVLGLDTLEIYGTDIYILWSYKCNRDVRELMMLIRAWQLGFVSGDEMRAVAKDQMRQVVFSQEKMDELNEKVCQRVESFQPRIVVGEVSQN